MHETTEERIQKLYRRDNPLAMAPLILTRAEHYIMAEIDRIAAPRRQDFKAVDREPSAE